MHYGSEPLYVPASNLFPTSSEVSELVKQLSAAERKSVVSSAEQVNEWAVRANEPTEERATQYLSFDFILIFFCSES